MEDGRASELITHSCDNEKRAGVSAGQGSRLFLWNGNEILVCVWGRVEMEISNQHKKTKTFQFEFSKYRSKRPGQVIRFVNVVETEVSPGVQWIKL